MKVYEAIKENIVSMPDRAGKYARGEIAAGVLTACLRVKLLIVTKIYGCLSYGAPTTLNNEGVIDLIYVF